MENPGIIRKKASTDLSFSYHGFYSDEEEPTQENKRVIDLKDPLDAISLNRDENRAVVAGLRGVLQIISVTADENSVADGPFIVKDVDLRNKKKSSLYNAAKNVKWNQNDDDLIAATSSAGAITVWVPSRRSHSILKAHERSATCLDWNREEKNVLISGSKDCHVYLFDIRTTGSKIDFIDGTSEAIHDVAFVNHPGACDLFFTGDDSGALKLWDRRNPSRFVFQRTAHNSFVSTISINPLDKYWLATGGGRDKIVKIWDWRNGRIERKFMVETMAPLGKCAWKPNHKFQLATCASVNDMNVHIWDIRRPFIPLATYEEHTDSVTDACWPFSSNSDTNLFLSCGKDNLVVLHTSESGHAPISYACDVPFDITPDGVLGIACNTKIQQKITEMEQLPNAARTSMTNRVLFPRFRRKTLTTKYEAFCEPVKSLMTCGIPDTMRISLPPNAFYELAQKYVLGGRKLSRICTINARAAKMCGKEHVAQTWRLVEALISQAKLQDIYDDDEKVLEADTKRKWDIRKRELAREGNRILPNVNQLNMDNRKRIFADRLESTLLINEFINISDDDSSPDSSNSSGSDSEFEKSKPKNNGKVFEEFSEFGEKKRRGKRHRNMSTAEFYFGGAESNYNHETEKKENLHLNEFMGLRDEAFELRTIFKDQKFFCAASQPGDEDGGSGWSPMMEVMRLLRYHSEQGDMQTCASIAIVCGRMLFDVVDTYTVGAWIDSYMEMCNRLELYVTIARIKKHASIYRVNQMSLEGTAVEIVHSECEKPIINGRCQACESVAAPTCTLCRQPVTGLFYECRVCRHSMHPDHAANWFRENRTCCATECLCDCGASDYPKMVRFFVKADDLEIVQKMPVKRRATKFDEKLQKLLGVEMNVEIEGSEKSEDECDDDDEESDSEVSDEEDSDFRCEKLESDEEEYANDVRDIRLSVTAIETREPSKILEMEPAHKSMIRQLEECGQRELPWGKGHFYQILKQMTKIEEEEEEDSEIEDDEQEKEEVLEESEEEEEDEDEEEEEEESDWESYGMDDDMGKTRPVKLALEMIENGELRIKSSTDTENDGECRVETNHEMSDIMEKIIKESKRIDEEKEEEEKQFEPKSYESTCTVMTIIRNFNEEEGSAVTSIRTMSPTLSCSPFAFQVFGTVQNSENPDILRESTMSTSSCLKQEIDIEVFESGESGEYEDEQEEEEEEVDDDYDEQEENEEEEEEEEEEGSEMKRNREIKEKLKSLIVNGNRKITMRGNDPFRIDVSEKDVEDEEEEEEEVEEEEEEEESSEEIEIEEEEEDEEEESESGWETDSGNDAEIMEEVEEEEEVVVENIEEEEEEEGISEEAFEELLEEVVDDHFDNREHMCECEMEVEELKTAERIKTDLSEYDPNQIRDFSMVLDRNNSLANYQFNQIEKDKVQNEKFILSNVKEIGTDCFNLQLEILESSPNIQQKSSLDSKIFAEFVQVFYFVPWKNVMDDELLLKKLYEMCEQYKKARKRTCRTHFWDFLFRFYSASLAAKIRFDYSKLLGINIEDGFKLENMDWTSLKSCLKSFEDFEEKDLDEIISSSSNDNEKENNWMIYERNFANKYWNIFGKVPIEIENRKSQNDEDLLNTSINVLEVGKRQKIRAKKVKRRKIRRMTKELFGIKIESKNEKVLKKFNEKHPDRVKNFIRHNNGENWEKSDIYQTTDSIFHRPPDTFYPICEFEDNGKIITIYPKVPKFLQMLKLRLRHKYTSKYSDCLRIDSRQFQTSDLLRQRRFRRFSRKLAAHLEKRPRRVSRKLETINEENDGLMSLYLMKDTVRNTVKQPLIDELYAIAEHDMDVTRRNAEDIKKYQNKILETNKRNEVANIWRMKWFPRLERNVKEARDAICKAKTLIDRDLRLWLEYEYLISQKRRSLAIQRRIERKFRRSANPFGIDPNPPIVDPKLIEFLPIDDRNIIETEEEEENENEEENWQNHAYKQGCLSIIDIERDFDFDDEKHFYEARTKPDIEEVDTNTTTSQGTCPTSPSDDESMESWYNENIVENMESIDYEFEQKMIKKRLQGCGEKSEVDRKSERFELYQELKEYLRKTCEKSAEIRESCEIYGFIRRLHTQEMRRVANRAFKTLHMRRNEGKIEKRPKIGTLNFLDVEIEPLVQFEKMFSKYGRFYLKYCGDEMSKKHFLKATFAWFLRKFGENMEMDRDIMRRLIHIWWENGRGELDEFYRIVYDHRANSSDFMLGFTIDKIDELGPELIEFIKDEYNAIQVAEVMNDMLSEVSHYELQQKQLKNEVCIENPWLRNYFKSSIMRMNMVEFFQWKWVACYEKLAVFCYDAERFKKMSRKIARRDVRMEKTVEKIVARRYGDEKEQEKDQISEEDDYFDEDSDDDSEEISTLHLIVNDWALKNEETEESNDGMSSFRRLVTYLLVHVDQIDPDFEKILSSFLAKYPDCAELMYTARCVTGYYEKAEYDEVKRRMIEFGARKNGRDSDVDVSWEDEESEFSEAPTHVSGNENDDFMDIVEKFGIKRCRFDTRYVNLEFCQEVEKDEMKWEEEEEDDEKEEKNEARMIRYNSLENVMEHELYFAREESEYRIPRLVVVFESDEFWSQNETVKYEQIIEKCTSSFDFCRRVQNRRIFEMARIEFREEILRKYGGAQKMSNCLISIIIDNRCRPWFYLIQSKNDENEKSFEKCGSVEEMNRYLMFEETARNAETIIEYMRIDRKVLELCLILREDDTEEATNLEEIFDVEMEDLKRDEGVRALDTIMRMKTPRPERQKLMEEIFRPIYDNWYSDWKIWCKKQKNSDVIYPAADNSEQNTQNQIKLAMNYAYQYYRMIKYDPVLSKTKCKDFSIRFPTFRQDVPSSSLLSNLREFIVNFLDNTSKDLPNRDIINKQILEIAEHGNPNPRVMYSRHKRSDELEAKNINGGDNDGDEIGDDGGDGSNEDLHSVTTVTKHHPNGIYASHVRNRQLRIQQQQLRQQMDVCDEIDALRSKFAAKDLYRRRFTAQIAFEIVKMTMARISPMLANFKMAEKRFDELLDNRHVRQRPLLDMMLTKITGVEKMTIEQRQSLLHFKLISVEDLPKKKPKKEEPARRPSAVRRQRLQPSNRTAISDIESMGRNSAAEKQKQGERRRSVAPRQIMPRLPEPFSSDEYDEEEEPEPEPEPKEKKPKEDKMRKESELSYDEDDEEEVNEENTEEDEPPVDEKKVLGEFLWERRNALRHEYQDIAMNDRAVVLEKLPRKLRHTIDRITQTIRDNCIRAHPSWGKLRRIERWDFVSNPNGPTQQEIRRNNGNVPKRMYIAPKVYDATNPAQNGSRWF